MDLREESGVQVWTNLRCPIGDWGWGLESLTCGWYLKSQASKWVWREEGNGQKTEYSSVQITGEMKANQWRRLRRSSGEVGESQDCVEPRSPEAQKESVSRSEKLCQELLLYQVIRLKLSPRLSYAEVTVTLMRAVRGKQKGTSLIQVGSRAHSRDAVLGACLDWKIPNIPLWTQRFYSLIILILEKVWFVGGQLKRNKLYQFLKVSKGFGEVWLWPRAQWQSDMFPLSIHSWDWVPGVQSSHLLGSTSLSAFALSLVSLSYSSARVSWDTVPYKLFAPKSLSEVYFLGNTKLDMEGKALKSGVSRFYVISSSWPSLLWGRVGSGPGDMA